jgi:NET1-associated nuclear protein 1 (U3 small nucleolar RNA-associated protein 17)
MHSYRGRNFPVFWTLRASFVYRGQIPSHASWAPDGSLLAVAHGPYVTIWDPVTHTLRQALTCPQVSLVSQAIFVGKGGRYIASIGHEASVLWDLVAMTGKKQSTCVSTIQGGLIHATS